MSVRFILLLGSNMGDRVGLLQAASEGISRRIGPVDRISALYETAAWGKTDQEPFLNQVVSGMTTLSVQEVLSGILEIEVSLGRIRTSKWEPRTIDIDILFFGDEVVSLPELEVPHPMLHQRRFTLAPLCDIFPEFRHPVLGQSMQQLLAAVEDPLQVTVYQPQQ